MRSLAKYFYEIVKKEYQDWCESNKGSGIPGRFVLKEFDANLVEEIINNINYLSYRKAKNKLKKFNMKTVTDYQLAKKNKKLGQDFPYNASKFYTKEWKGWADFLGKK